MEEADDGMGWIYQRFHSKVRQYDVAIKYCSYARKIVRNSRELAVSTQDGCPSGFEKLVSSNLYLLGHVIELLYIFLIRISSIEYYLRLNDEKFSVSVQNYD